MKKILAYLIAISLAGAAAAAHVPPDESGGGGRSIPAGVEKDFRAHITLGHDEMARGSDTGVTSLARVFTGKHLCNNWMDCWIIF